MDNMHVNEPLLKQIIKIQGAQALKISDFENKIDGVERGVIRILSYIENDESTGTKGVVAKQKDMSKRISSIEKGIEHDKLKTKTTIAVASTIGGIIATAGTFVAKFFLLK